MITDGEIRLEPLGEEHLEDLASLGHDPLVRRHTRVPDPWPDGFEREWLDAIRRGREQGTRESFAIVDRAGVFAGLVGLVSIETDEEQGEIGYIVAPDARGRGLATRALRLMSDHAFGHHRLQRLQLVITTDNEPSMRVAERCGYHREGVARSLYLKPGRRADMVVYARLPTDGEAGETESGTD
jgi:RimJ/RimL family protein N-acetyltransferase